MFGVTLNELVAFPTQAACDFTGSRRSQSKSKNIFEIFFLAVQMSFSHGIFCRDYKRSLCSYAGIRCISAASAVWVFRWMCLFCCLSLILLHLCDVLRFHFTPGILDSAVIKSASTGSFSSYLGAYISIQDFFQFKNLGRLSTTEILDIYHTFGHKIRFLSIHNLSSDCQWSPHELFFFVGKWDFLSIFSSLERCSRIDDMYLLVVWLAQKSTATAMRLAWSTIHIRLKGIERRSRQRN